MRLSDDMESEVSRIKMHLVGMLRSEGRDVEPDDLQVQSVGRFDDPDNDPDRPEIGSVIKLKGKQMEVVEVNWEWVPIMAAGMLQQANNDIGSYDGKERGDDGFVRRADGLARCFRIHATNKLVAWVAWCREVQ
jgi:hypothetical protein